MAVYTATNSAPVSETVTTIDLTSKPSQTPTGLAVDTFVNTGHELLLVKNTNEATTTITLNSQENCVFGTDHNATVTVALNEVRLFPRLDPVRFGTSVLVTYSANYADMRVDIIKVL